MPYVLSYNRPAISDRMTALARYLDLPSPSFEAVLDWVVALRAEVGIPHRLDAIGVDEAVVPRLAEMAARDPSCGGNPRPLDPAILADLYRASITGQL
jgi:alcohol dehydrogenase class IV